jgi:hypothetical protein
MESNPSGSADSTAELFEDAAMAVEICKRNERRFSGVTCELCLVKVVQHIMDFIIYSTS